MTRIHQIKQKVKQILRHDYLLMTIFLLFIASLYSFAAITIHNQYMTFALDLGVFDESIWKISQAKFPYSGVGCNWLLEDHFQIIFYLLAPLFWIWNNVRILLITQATAMAFAGLPLYLLAKEVTKNKIFSFSVVCAYLFFIGTQFSILNEIHQITFAPIIIATAYLMLAKNKIKGFLLSILCLFFIKEDLSMFIATLGLGLLFHKKYRKLGIITFLAGIGFFFFLVYIFMPNISIKGVYDHFHFGKAGSSPQEIVVNVLTNPAFFVESMTSPPIKMQTAWRSFVTFGFLPLLAPLTYLVPLLADFAMRFIYAGPQYTKWGLVNHHAAVSAIMLGITCIYGAVRLKDKKLLTYTAMGVLLLILTSVTDLMFHGPINSILKRQFYERQQWMIDNDAVISRVPAGASVGAQNNLAPHLTHRETIYRLPYGSNSEYIVIDMHDGPNKYAPLSFEEMKKFVDELITSGKYSIEYEQGDAMLLRRNFKTDLKKSKYFGDTRYCYYSFEENL